MKLELTGHDYRYAVEQSILSFFPEERPVYEGEDGFLARVSLCQAGAEWLAETQLLRGEESARGASSGALPETEDVYELEREKQRLVKLSVFKAARALTGISPPWGALTGIRPGKVASQLLEQGKTPVETDDILNQRYFVTAPRRQMCLETAQAGLAAAGALAERDIALYIGIPFCPTRCAYCSFVSNSVEKSFHLVEPYLQALLAEVVAAGEMVAERGLRIRAFYMGGGTPTTLTAQQMQRLLAAVNRHFDLSHCHERTVEAGRPDTIDPEKLAVLKAGGVTRLSINPQTMEDAVLQAIGRRHSADDIRRAMAEVAAVGFESVNMDLIAGLPQDSPAGFRRSLDEVLAMGADNVTIHTLSLKKGSRLLTEGGAIPDAAAVGEMLDYGSAALRGADFAPYYLYRQKYMSGSFENIGWCIAGQENRYNIYIMEELCSILSLGAGGSTKMVGPGGGRIERAFNFKYPLEYIQRPEKARANLAAFSEFYRNRKGAC